MTLYKYPKIERYDKVEQYLKEQDTILVQEKVDGSNVSFYYQEGSLVFQSRNTVIDPNSPGMFQPFIEWVTQLDKFGFLSWMEDGELILYGEMMGNGKIKYESWYPFLGFDVYNRYTQAFDPSPHLFFERTRLIPYIEPLYVGEPLPKDSLVSYLNTHTFGEKSEGIVIKGYNVHGRYAKGPDEYGEFVEPLMGGKIVHDDYAELKKGKTSIRDASDPITKIMESVVTEARVAKARQRMYEKGNMSPQPHELIKLVATDVMEEEREYIKDQLFKANGKALSSALAQQVLALADKRNE